MEKDHCAAKILTFMLNIEWRTADYP